MLDESLSYFLQDQTEIESIDSLNTTTYLNNRTPPKLGPLHISSPNNIIGINSNNITNIINQIEGNIILKKRKNQQLSK